VLLHVPWLWFPPLCLGGLRCCHTSLSSRPRPTLEVGSGAAICPLALGLASLWATGHKHKEKPSWMLVQLSLCVTEARTHVSKTPDIRAIRGLQDVWAGNVFNAYQMCGHAATVQLQYITGLVDHSQGIGTLPCC
jgi:hypothetical protein